MESIKSIWSVVKNVLSPEKVVPANAVPIVPVDNPGQERVPKIAPTPDNTDEKLGRIPAAAEFDQHTPGQDHGTSPTSSTPVSENSSTTLDSSTQLVSPEIGLPTVPTVPVPDLSPAPTPLEIAEADITADVSAWITSQETFLPLSVATLLAPATPPHAALPNPELLANVCTAEFGTHRTSPADVNLADPPTAALLQSRPARLSPVK